MTDRVQFYLPFGLELEGKTYREGVIRLATAKDELEIQGNDNVAMNSRYRDLLLLSKVIENLGDLSPVSVEILEELYETDFLYLQLLYKSLNGGEEIVSVTCPGCGRRTTLTLPPLYKDMSVYKEG